jgi:hypothetical protein
MLSATYTAVALSVERTSLRLSLQSLQTAVHANFYQQRMLTETQVENACCVLNRIYESYHLRKLDKFLVPAIRRTTHLASQLLLELDRLSQTAVEAMSAALYAERAALDTTVRVTNFCVAVDGFCFALLRRLQREEEELLPLARAVISGEVWFAIANQMLAHDTYQHESRGIEMEFRPGRDGIRRAESTSRKAFRFPD